METKVTPKTETEALFADLDKPSLHALSYVLRHPDTWPKGFYWDYTKCTQCAMGLARRLWSTDIEQAKNSSGASIMARTFAMPYAKAERIFMEGWKNHRHLGVFSRDPETVTPEMIADDIDRYLASRG